MKKIADSRKLLGTLPSATLQDLSARYKTLMKQHHPDKFTDEKEKAEAESYSKHLIDAYHFLVSIAPETHARNIEEYTLTTGTGAITDWHYQAQTLKLTFGDGTEYEYYHVPANVYNKFLNNQSSLRFARRHICSSFTRRRLAKKTAEEQK